MRRIILAAVTAAVVSACSSIDCPVQNSVYTNYALYKADGGVDTLRDTLSVQIGRASCRERV